MFNMPQMKNPLEGDSSCEHFNFFEKLGVTTRECLRGANLARRCNQANYAQIILLSNILDRLPSQGE
jgi:hypothetical protein